MSECRLTERIEIEELISTTQNSKGFDIPNWQLYYGCWSSYDEVKGSKFIAAKADKSEDIVTFTIRYCNKVKPLLLPGAKKRFRVIFNGFIYAILFAGDYENRHEWVDIKAKIIS